jgi:hypothetical protein
METKVKWGTIVHPDNTIEKRVVSYFEDKEIMFHVWKRRNEGYQNPNTSHTMNINALTIATVSYVQFEEYLEYMGDEEE